MYKISKTTQFKKDYKLIVKRNYDILKLQKAVNLLVTTDKLPIEYKEHPLKNIFKYHFDCHLEPDWLLIFKRDDVEKIITLVRTGTHSDIFG